MNFCEYARYYKDDVSKEWLRKNNFHYNKEYSDVDSDVYTMRFPLHKYRNITTLEGELAVNTLDGNVTVNVFMQNNMPYPPFYYVPCGNYEPVLSDIGYKITNVFNKLKIKERKAS